eukprot:7321744-Lingulodinium_polyedra.AAC.1
MSERRRLSRCGVASCVRFERVFEHAASAACPEAARAMHCWHCARAAHRVPRLRNVRNPSCEPPQRRTA